MPKRDIAIVRSWHVYTGQYRMLHIGLCGKYNFSNPLLLSRHTLENLLNVKWVLCLRWADTQAESLEPLNNQSHQIPFGFLPLLWWHGSQMKAGKSYLWWNTTGILSVVYWCCHWSSQWFHVTPPWDSIFYSPHCDCSFRSLMECWVLGEDIY